MYITTTTPDKTVSVAYSGSTIDRCGTGLVERYVVGPKIKERSWVTSWRGKKEKDAVHNFERFKYAVTGCEMLHICNAIYKGRKPGEYCTGDPVSSRGVPASCEDGGRYWMYLLSDLGALNPQLHFTPQEYILGEADDECRRYTVQAAFAKANSPKFGGLVQLAELGEAVSYFKGIASTLVRIFFKTKNRRHGLFDIFDRVKNPESTWLEWRYAILPMILSVQDLISALQQGKGSKSKVDHYWTDTDVQVRDHVFDYGLAKLAFKSRYTKTLSCGVGLDVLFQCDPAPWGFGAYDAVLAFWEKQTLSFVLDWFLDVGQWLESFRNTDLLLGNRYSTLVKKSKLEVWFDEGNSRIGQSIVVPTEDDPFIVSAHHIKREINDSVVPPTLPMFTPGKLSLFRKLDGLSLILGALKSLRR